MAADDRTQESGARRLGGHLGDAANGPAVALALDHGRASFEWAVLFSSLSLLSPALGVFAVGFSLRARRLGSPKWVVVLVASLWCVVLGAIVRIGFGLEIVP